MPENDPPDPIAQFDQLLRGMTEWARLMKAHFDACTAAGFTEPQAFALTLAYMGGLQQGARNA